MTLAQRLKQYREYFGPSNAEEFNGLQMMLQRRRDPVSSNLEFTSSNVKTPFSDDEVLRYALNHPHDLLSAIRKHDSHAYLDEALTFTWPGDKAVQLFKSTCKRILPEKLQDLAFSDLYRSPKHSGKIIDYHGTGPSGDALLAFAVPYAIHEGSRKTVKAVVDAMYVSGYILSFSEDMSLTSKMKTLGVGLCLMQFEARYSRKETELSDCLYHVSPSRYFSKIVKHGLVPRSGSAIYKYPERVYLFNQASVSFVKDFGVVKQLQMLDKNLQWVDDTTFVIYAVERDKLLKHPLYTSGKMVFYIDPRYDGSIGGVKVCEAIYTYSHIPIELVEKNVFVYSLHNDAGHMSAKLKGMRALS